MTVIAWDGRTLAADTQTTFSNTGFRSVGKIFEIVIKGRLCLVGTSGNSGSAVALRGWLASSADPEKFPSFLLSNRAQNDFCDAMVIKEDGFIDMYEHWPYPVSFTPQKMAMGSGRDYALAAMHCGKTAVDAVEIACHFDTTCGPPIKQLCFPGLMRIDSGMGKIISHKSLGELCVERRGRLGVRQAGAEAGLSASTYSRVENGYLPDVENFSRICKWLKISMDQGFKAWRPMGECNKPGEGKQ